MKPVGLTLIEAMKYLADKSNDPWEANKAFVEIYPGEKDTQNHRARQRAYNRNYRLKRNGIGS